MKLSESRIKQIIKEEMDLMEMEFDPYTIVIGAGAAYGLYKMLFGREPSSAEEALKALRKKAMELELEAEEAEKRGRFPKPPGQGDFQKIKARQKLNQLKKERGEM